MAEGQLIQRGISGKTLSATGGTVTDITQDGKQYRVHTFTSDGTFEVTRGGDVEYLVIAGGGGGGDGSSSSFGGGGGAGGYRSSVQGESSGGGASAEPLFSVSSGINYTVIVGSGGTAENKGDDSVFASVTSEGGGFGGSTGSSSGDGGSGGGRPWSGTRGLGTANQGFDGSNFNSGGAGGGGGGAGSEPISTGGGSGLASLITGSSVTRAQGGGSGFDGTAQPNTGNGGNSQNNPRTGIAGGSGIVIIRYRIG